MIPSSAGDLDALIAEVGRQTGEVRLLLEGLTPDACRWRSAPDRWSIMGHLAHLCLVNGPYVQAIGPCIERARAGRIMSDGPYRHGWFGKWFTREMEPPPKRRIRTGKRMRPDPQVDGDSTLEEFEHLQGEWTRLMKEARGVDLGKARFSSPFMKLLRFSLGTGFSALMAHNRRHIWLIHELMGHDGFPLTESDE